MQHTHSALSRVRVGTLTLQCHRWDARHVRHVHHAVPLPELEAQRHVVLAVEHLQFSAAAEQGSEGGEGGEGSWGRKTCRRNCLQG